MHAIEIEHLNKTYPPAKKDTPGTIALQDISCCLPPAKIAALLGANGAGKTTLLKILATLLIPDAGSARINGFTLGRDDHRIRAQVGLVTGDERGFYWRLSGMQNLEFFASLYGLSRAEGRQRINALLEQFTIESPQRRFDAYSTGIKKRFCLIRGLLHQPSILLLDEPCKGLDQKSRQRFLRYLTQTTVGAHGACVLMATHDPDEIEPYDPLCLVLHRGRLVAVGSREELRSATRQPNASLKSLTAAPVP